MCPQWPIDTRWIAHIWCFVETHLPAMLRLDGERAPVCPRRRVLTTLLAISREIERVESSDEGRRTCREVRVLLRRALGDGAPAPENR